MVNELTEIINSIPDFIFGFISFGGLLIGYIFNELLHFLKKSLSYLEIKISQIKGDKQ